MWCVQSAHLKHMNDFFQICHGISTQVITKERDSQDMPYAFNNFEWVGYDDATSVQHKVGSITYLHPVTSSVSCALIKCHERRLSRTEPAFFRCNSSVFLFVKIIVIPKKTNIFKRQSLQGFEQYIFCHVNRIYSTLQPNT